MTLRDVIISVSFLSALSFFSCGNSSSSSEEVSDDDRDNIASSLPNKSKFETDSKDAHGNVFMGKTVIPGFPYEMEDTCRVYPVLNLQNAYWQEPDGKYTYMYLFNNISDRDVVIERVEFESEPSDSAIVQLGASDLESEALTYVAIKVAKPYPKGFRRITFYLKGQETPEVHTMEVLEKMPIPEN